MPTYTEEYGNFIFLKNHINICTTYYVNFFMKMTIFSTCFVFSFNNSIFLSERETADRNFALAYYMKENKCFPKGFVLQECLDFYFQVSKLIFIYCHVLQLNCF